MKSVYDKEFALYGKVLEGYDFSELFEALTELPVPEEGIIYEASVESLEKCKVFMELQNRGFGGMPVQAGYVGGTNDRLNCLEYHKSSEFNIAKDEVVLLLGLESDIQAGKYDTKHAEAFRIPAETGIELYGTTLHYAPCGRGYRVACILPRSTNEAGQISVCVTEEDQMYAGKNKWLLAHPDSPAADERAYLGLTGENLAIEE